MDLTKKTFINVQKYADMYNLTLEEAHNEIQPWLFEQGIHHAYPSYKGKVVFTEREIVEVSMDKPLAITSCHMDVFCKEGYEQELTLSRKVVLTPSTSNLVEYVTINGKQLGLHMIFIAGKCILLSISLFLKNGWKSLLRKL